MWLIGRIVFGAAFVWVLHLAWRNAQAAPETGDIANAGFLGLAVILAIANAIVWAPFFGGHLSDPLTGAITRSTYVERKNFLLKAVRWLEARGLRRAALTGAFLEGIHHPELPAPFILGLRNARPGSWLEQVFAFEVWRFDNVQHCLQAYEVLQRHGIDPRPHRNNEVNRALLALERHTPPESSPLPVPTAPPAPPPERDLRIHLFAGADPRSTTSTEEPAPAASDAERPIIRSTGKPQI